MISPQPKRQSRKDQGELIYLFLHENFDKGFTVKGIVDAIPELGLEHDSSGFRCAMRHARRFAEANGFMIPVAGREDDEARPGWTTVPKYRVTNRAVRAFLPALKLSRQASGTKRTQQRHDNFMLAANLEGLTPSERMVVEARMKADEATRLQLESTNEMQAAFLEQRREHQMELRRMSKEDDE